MRAAQGAWRVRQMYIKGAAELNFSILADIYEEDPSLV
jgi:hypothetical protein